MFEYWRISEPETQITFLICVTVLLLAVIACAVLYFWHKAKCKKEHDVHQDGANGNNKDNTNSPSPNPAPAAETETEKRHKEEDRAKALVKDFFEAARTKTTDKDGNKVEACKEDIANAMFEQYKQILALTGNKQS